MARFLFRRWLAPLLLIVLPVRGDIPWPHRPTEDSQTLKPEISVDLPLGLPYARARLFVDDVDVTEHTVRTSLFVTYRPELPLEKGPHRVRLQIGETQHDWSFQVVGRQLIEGCVYTAPADSHAFGKVNVEMRGIAHGKAWAELTGFPEHHKLNEDKGGLYRGSFKIPARLAGRSARVECFLQRGDELDRQTCPGELKLAALELKLSWTAPLNNSRVESPVRVEGQAVPDSLVKIQIHPFFRDGIAFGTLPADSTESVRSDAEGRFSLVYTFPPKLQRLAVRLRAVVMDERGNASPHAELILSQGAAASKLPPLNTEVPSVP